MKSETPWLLKKSVTSSRMIGRWRLSSWVQPEHDWKCWHWRAQVREGSGDRLRLRLGLGLGLGLGGKEVGSGGADG